MTFWIGSGGVDGGRAGKNVLGTGAKKERFIPNYLTVCGESKCVRGLLVWNLKTRQEVLEIAVSTLLSIVDNRLLLTHYTVPYFAVLGVSEVKDIWLTLNV